MQEETTTLKQNETWELAIFQPGKKAIGCKWVYSVKLNPDGSVAHLNVRLVVKRYSYVYELNYVDTYFLVTKMTCADTCVIVSNILLATSSIRHQE